MKHARREAGINMERRKVVGVRTSERTFRKTGVRWAYVAECGTECAVCENRKGRVRG